MKTVSTLAFQGDVAFRRVEKLPAGVTEVARKDGEPLVVTHSETGHHHVIASRNARMYTLGKNALLAYLVIGEMDKKKKAAAKKARAKAREEMAEADIAKVEHLRTFDTHETLALEPGVWEVRRQREHTPEGWTRAVLD